VQLGGDYQIVSSKASPSRFLGADVAAGSEEVAVRGDFGGGGGFAEAGDVGVATGPRYSPPCMVGGDDLLEVGVGQLAVVAVDERPHFPRIDEERLPTVRAPAFRWTFTATLPAGFAFRQKPKADGNLRAVEELAGERDHAVHEVGLDEGAADVASPSEALRIG